MFSPAIANVLTRLITNEGTQDLLIKPHFGSKRWLFWIIAWFAPGILTILGLVVYFLIFPAQFDPAVTQLSEQVQAMNGGASVNMRLVIISQVLQAFLLAPLLNAIPTFGEEFGWRGYLQPKLMQCDKRKGLLITNIIWGIWHWPIILMGYNYGTQYVGAPFLGPFAMTWFTVIVGVFLGWLTLKSQNVWPAVIGHGALNGIAALGLLVVRGEPHTLLGPAPTGLIGGIGFALTAILIFILSPTLKNEAGESTKTE
jgi:membrane protease YdiL (CAAX protease family)